MVRKQSEKEKIIQLITEKAKKYGVDPYLALAVAKQESGYNQKAKSKVGAIGVMQLMPDTAKSLGVNPNNLEGNIEGGIKYLRNALDHYNGDVEKALASYNAGFQAVDDYMNGTNLSGQNPLKRKNSNVYDGTGYKETRNYVKNIMANYNKNAGSNNMMIASNTNDTPTGAAANITQGNDLDLSVNRPVFPTSAEELANRYAQSRGVNTPADYITNANEAYMQYINDPRVQQYIQQPVARTGELINQTNQPTIDAALALQKASQEQDALNYQRLQDLYRQQMETIQSDPRLQNVGYKLDPNKVGQSIGGVAMSRLAGLENPVTYMDVQNEMAKAELANRYGVPYDTLVAAHQDRINRELDVQKNNVAVMNTLIQNAKSGDTQAAKILEKVAEQNGTTVQKIVEQNNKIAEEIVKAGANAINPAITAASADARELLSQDAQNLRNRETIEASLYGTDVRGATDLATNARSNATELQKAQMATDLGYNTLGVNKALGEGRIDAMRDASVLNNLSNMYYTNPDMIQNVQSNVNPRYGSMLFNMGGNLTKPMGTSTPNTQQTRPVSGVNPLQADMLFDNYINSLQNNGGSAW
jgi:hypothetical protein